MSVKKNLSAVLYGIDNIRIEHRDIPPLKNGDVLLVMKCVGICGSDLHYWKHGRIADFVVKEPMVLGHEASGVVYKVGPDVKHLKEGDRVAIEPGIPCFQCSKCKQGTYNLCPKMVFCATPPNHGNLSQYAVHASAMCYKLPDHVSFEEAALLEPLAVAVHACKRGNVGVGKNVLILGSGPIGLVTLITAKHMGAHNIVITDTNILRLKMAQDLQAHTIEIKIDMSENEFNETVEKYFGQQPDVTIDCIGLQNTVRQGIQVTKPGGTLVIVGMAGPLEMTIPLVTALIKEVDIRGTFRYVNDYEDALSIVSKGKSDILRLVTHKYKLSETVRAFEDVQAGKTIKAMIYCNE